MRTIHRITATKGTAIAVVNALVAHLKLGHFMLQYEMFALDLKASNVTQCVLIGKTDKGLEFVAKVNFHRAYFAGEDGRVQVVLPMERIFNCHFTDKGIEFRE